MSNLPAEEMTAGYYQMNHCTHGVAPYMVCGKCRTEARQDRMEARQVEVWERLISILEKVEAKL